MHGPESDQRKKGNLSNQLGPGRLFSKKFGSGPKSERMKILKGPGLKN